MKCKKDSCEKCLCLKRKHEGCADCEKKAIEIIRIYGRDLNDDIKNAKETGRTFHDLYIGVDGINGDPLTFAWRSAIDILRGVCKYCKRVCSKACAECMWSNDLNGEDHWFFDDSLLDSISE